MPKGKRGSKSGSRASAATTNSTSGANMPSLTYLSAVRVKSDIKAVVKVAFGRRFHLIETDVNIAVDKAVDDAFEARMDVVAGYDYACDIAMKVAEESYERFEDDFEDDEEDEEDATVEPTHEQSTNQLDSTRHLHAPPSQIQGESRAENTGPTNDGQPRRQSRRLQRLRAQ
ncbi:hypothetical protein RUND412_009359 [Rhizina undulata]